MPDAAASAAGRALRALRKTRSARSVVLHTASIAGMASWPGRSATTRSVARGTQRLSSASGHSLPPELCRHRVRVGPHRFHCVTPQAIVWGGLLLRMKSFSPETVASPLPIQDR